MLKEVAEWIEDLTSFVVGTTIQVGYRPQSAPDRCNVILETPGGDPISYTPGSMSRNDKVFQIISRSERPGHATTKGMWDARDDSWEIFNAIFANSGYVLPVIDAAYFVMYVEAQSDPQYIGFDENGRFEYSVDYIVKLRNN